MSLRIFKLPDVLKIQPPAVFRPSKNDRPAVRPAMAGILAALALLLVLAAPTAPAAARERYEGRVQRVLDGDTADVLTGDFERIRVRFYGLDAPEKNQDGGDESRAALDRLIAGREVSVLVMDVDRYSRQVGVVYLDGVSVNLEMIALGQAWVYEQYCRDRKICGEFRRAQSRAREAGLGLWADPDPTPPWDHRRNRRNSKK